MNRSFLHKTFLSGEEKKRYWLIRFFIGGFVILFALGLWLNLRTGIYVGGDFLYRKNAETYARRANVIKVQQDGNQANFEATYWGEVTRATLVWEETAVTGSKRVSVTFDDGEVIEGTWENWGGLGWSFVEEGENWGVGNIYFSLSAIPNTLTKCNWSSVFCGMVFSEPSKSGSIEFVLLGAFCYIVGAVGYLYPEQTHELLGRWRYRRLELSDAGIYCEMAGGVLCMILGICFMLGLLPV